MEHEWPPADQGLFEAKQLLRYIEQYNKIPPNIDRSPLPLQVDEENLKTTSARLLRWDRSRVRPTGFTYFRLKPKWAADPLMAPFIWILVLPFNIISWFISRERATETYQQWVEVGNGPLVITQLALLQATPGGLLRIPWIGVKSVSLNESPPGINLTYMAKNFFFELPEQSRLWVYVASRFLAFNESDLQLPYLD